MLDNRSQIIRGTLDGKILSSKEALLLADYDELPVLLDVASQLRDQGHGNLISYSRNVFIPLTQLCRDVCHYCTFAQPPKKGESAYLTLDEMLAIARAGAESGCTEALFTLGDKPELRYQVAQEELSALGHQTTLDYLHEAAALIARETGLLPHVNPGVMTADNLSNLREVSVSQGIMLESVSNRLMNKGEVHFGSPDKDPETRLETIRLAGKESIPFTSGILIGIGETRRERIESLLALRDIQSQYGHIQELIIQNFRAKPETKMANSPEPSFEDLLWTLAITRILFGPQMNVQAPPNLTPNSYKKLIDAGLSDWGGVSPITVDHVNPEAPWPEINNLEKETTSAGKELVERLAIYPNYAKDHKTWLSKEMSTLTMHAMDTEGFARDGNWSPGDNEIKPPSITMESSASKLALISTKTQQIVTKARNGNELSEEEIVDLFKVRGKEFAYVCDAANQLRKEVSGETVRYVVNRNINYTNICYFKCQFCAFSKGKLSENLRGKPYNLGLDEVVRRAKEAWERGATEACMQGGIHPDYTGETYLGICRAIKEALPDIHLHAFSPLEVWQGAETLGIPVPEFLKKLKEAGLGTLPGTAAEILDDDVRMELCPDKINTSQWLSVIEDAHRGGFTTTSTIMYGHMEKSQSWAKHLLHLRHLQERTGGITEFVPLPFVHMEAPIFLKGRARKGPTFREAILMHAVARLVLHPVITNIQVSWVKMGDLGSSACLQAGANDLGGTLMNESISRAAGASFGEEMSPEQMDKLILELGRTPKQRNTVYGSPSEERTKKSYLAPELEPIVLQTAHSYSKQR